MSKEYRAKVFKSGNSLALRLPKALGLVNGEEVVVVAHVDGGFTMWRASASRDVFMALYGSMSGGFMADGRGEIEQEERDWSVAPKKAAA